MRSQNNIFCQFDGSVGKLSGKLLLGEKVKKKVDDSWTEYIQDMIKKTNVSQNKNKNKNKTKNKNKRKK